MSRVVVIGVIVVLAACRSAPAPAAPPRLAEIDALVAATQKEHPFVGLSIAVARGGRVIHAKGYGFADAATRAPATADTVYRIASVSKQFTAAAILQLVDAGELALHDDIRRYLPDYPAHDTAITIEHLLAHSSGIANYTAVANWREIEAKPMTHAELVALFAGKPLAFRPGERFDYSNSNYYLLGLILEKITRQPYADVIRDRLFVPAGMTASAYCDAAMPRAAAGYTLRDAKPEPARPIELDHAYAAGALCSTVLDLIAWQRALDGGKLLKPASLARMRTAFALTGGATSRYGYGLFIGELGGHRRTFHAGGINGFAAQLTRFPDDDVTIAVLANAEVAAPQHVDERVARALLHVPATQRATVALSPAERTRYVGTYQLEGFPMQLRIFEEGGALRAQATGQPPTTMLYQGNATFGAEADTSLEIVFAAGTPAPRFTLTQRGMTIEAKRISAK